MEEEAKNNEEKKEDPKEKTKEELFKENPERFIDINTLVVATIMVENQLCIFLNPRAKRSEIMRSLGEIQTHAVMMSMLKPKSVIQSPPGGIIGAARRGLFRR